MTTKAMSQQTLGL